MDLSIALPSLMILAPLMALIALMIKLWSKGPIIYSQDRIGANYKLFKMLKFRTMYLNADELVNDDSLEDIYDENSDDESSDEINQIVPEKTTTLIGNNGEVFEHQHLEDKPTKSFRKFKNDPRITKIGKILRRTSLDELPQLWNVITGDLSIIGNRPLPIYEAEKLLVDDCVGRFMAPAGLTGLWQVMRKKKKYNGVEARIRLDIKYADEYSFWYDLKILFLTPFSLLQEKNS